MSVCSFTPHEDVRSFFLKLLLVVFLDIHLDIIEVLTLSNIVLNIKRLLHL